MIRLDVAAVRVLSVNVLDGETLCNFLCRAGLSASQIVDAGQAIAAAVLTSEITADGLEKL